MSRHRRAAMVVLAALATGGAPAAVRPVAAHPAAAHPHATTSCEEAKRTNAWCSSGKVGYVAGVPIRSRFLYEVLDAHGHAIDPARVTCATCRKAIETNGYCPAHRMGYVGGEAWMSPLTWHLARATRVDPKAITCATCRRHLEGIGWCETDKVGLAGPFAVADRATFDALAAAYRILVQANGMAKRCETCAGAMITDETCGIHHVTYAAGKAVRGTPP